jgi:hypothetical protein
MQCEETLTIFGPIAVLPSGIRHSVPNEVWPKFGRSTRGLVQTSSAQGNKMKGWEDNLLNEIGCTPTQPGAFKWAEYTQSPRICHVSCSSSFDRL